MYLFFDSLEGTIFSWGRKKGQNKKKGPKQKGTKQAKEKARRRGPFCLSSAPTTNMPHAEHCGPSFVWRMYCNLHETVRKKERFLTLGVLFFFLPAARASSPRRRSSGPSSCARPYTRIETPSLLFLERRFFFWIREQRRNAPFKASRAFFLFSFFFFLFSFFFFLFFFFSFFSFHSRGAVSFLCRDPMPKPEEKQKRNRLTNE
jgi:hypothetical protein